MSKFSKLSVVVTGGEPPEPLIVRSTHTVGKEMEKLLPDLSSNSAILFHAQVGSGKTYATVHVLLPWVREQGKRMLYVSSRIAINTQVKSEIIAETGEKHLLAEHTEQGMRVQQDFNGVAVITYHSLYFIMVNKPTWLKKFDILVFDEIHALLEDALFVPYTGYILEHLRDFFGDKIRIYYSATPEKILPYLTKAEAPYRLTVLRFRRD